MSTIPQKRSLEEYIEELLREKEDNERITQEIIRKKDETIQKLYDEKRIDQETIQELTHEKEERSVYMYLQEGGTLPELIQWGSLSGASISRSKIDASCVQRDFGCLADDVNEVFIENSKKIASELFSSTKQDSGYFYCSESEVSNYVRNVVMDVLAASGLTKKLKITSELKVSKLVSDHFVINCDGFPVGAIEVKKPGTITKNQEPKVFGQLYDYMAIIQSFCGTKHALGIFSNYNEWVICWFPESDVCASATNLDYECIHIPQLDASRREL